MINEYIRYKIEAERSEAFLIAYTEAAASLRASEHCLGYDLSRCSESPEHFILRIEWDSADGHMSGFRKSAHFPPFLRSIQPFIKDIEEMKHYERTTVQWTR